jgi:predicted ester cyclase
MAGNVRRGGLARNRIGAVCQDRAMTDDAAANKAVVERFLRDAMDRTTGKWNMDVIVEVFDVDRYFSHSWGAGLAETGRRMAEFFAPFEHVEMVSDDLVAENDFVVHRVTSRIRHIGECFGIAPTNRVLTIQRVEMWRLANGKIVEHWGGDGDIRNLFEQLTAAD